MLKIDAADDICIMYEPNDDRYYIKLKGTTLDKPVGLTITISRFEFVKLAESLVCSQKEKYI